MTYFCENLEYLPVNYEFGIQLWFRITLPYFTCPSKSVPTVNSPNFDIGGAGKKKFLEILWRYPPFKKFDDVSKLWALQCQNMNFDFSLASASKKLFSWGVDLTYSV